MSAELMPAVIYDVFESTVNGFLVGVIMRY